MAEGNDINVRRTTQVPYGFNDHTGFGELTQTSTPIAVDHQNDFSPEYNFALSLSHEHYLNCLLIDRDRNENDNGDYNTMVYHGFDRFLTEYVQTHRRIDTYHTRDYPSIAYDFIPESFRRIIRSMIRFVNFLHKEHKSLIRLDLENLVVKKDILKFWKVGFVDADPQTQRGDFHLIATIVERLYEGYPIIRSLRDLIDRMRNEDSIMNKILLENHLAILPTTERITFFRNVVEKRQLLDVVRPDSYEDVIEGLTSSRGWTRRFKSSRAKGAVYDCFSYRDNSTPYVDSTPYIDTENEQETNRSLLAFCRNLATHLAERMNARGYQFVDRDIDLTIMALFEQKLIEFEELLSIHGVIRFYF